jgi:hypothetical protein
MEVNGQIYTKDRVSLTVFHLSSCNAYAPSRQMTDMLEQSNDIYFLLS